MSIKNLLKALVNTLVIDNEPPVNSIHYQRSKIDNGFDICYNIEQLYDIFLDNAPVLFTVADKSVLSFILKDGSEISLFNYERNNDIINNINFLKISLPELHETDNDIYISIKKDHESAGFLCWTDLKTKIDYKQTLFQNQTITDLTKVAITDYDGYKHCKVVSDIYKTKRGNKILFPAVQYCCEKEIAGYVGYLPAAGQMEIIAKYMLMINYIFEKVGSEPLNALEFWTSTNYSNTEFFKYLILGNTKEKVHYMCGTYNKIMHLPVLPLFTKKEKLFVK